ncbi:hypothetical protein L3C95_30040 [Chitinophaga filiformis]|uniref:hypothetical protein n=1 Tax=Chitinophaga filiformis TaxID=104663 RepID=UPI001F1D24E9|nr:hypothetical protein [Chitinophaga filiformis]MCF6407175.1 hypothetical protein [Chitinophaga filiformis]
MKKLFALFVLAGAVAVTCKVQAQEIVKGDLAFLKGATGVNVVFVYDDLTVGKDGKEANYIKRKKAEKDEKEPGTGATWEENWHADKTKSYKPKFIKLLSKYTEWALNEDTKEKYTMVVNTKFIETGYYVGISSAAAELNLEIAIYDSSDMKKALCKITMDEVRAGRGMFDNASRIGEAYAKAGKDIGKLIAKKIK